MKMRSMPTKSKRANQLLICQGAKGCQVEVCSHKIEHGKLGNCSDGLCTKHVSADGINREISDAVCVPVTLELR